MRPFKKPKILYFYENKELHKHEVTPECWIEIVDEDSCFGVRYRCRNSGQQSGCYSPYQMHDYYGYGMLKEAKGFEMRQTMYRINTEREWYKKLNTLERPCQDCGPDGLQCDYCSGDGRLYTQRHDEVCPHCKGTKLCPNKKPKVEPTTQKAVTQ